MKKINLKKVLCSILAISMICSFALVGTNAKTIVRGDVNGDGNVQTSDARLALRGAAGIDILEGDAIIAADVNEDGNVQTSDARVILRVAAGLELFENSEIIVEESTDAEEPSDEETTTEEPTTEEPTTEEPTTEEPTTEEPTTEEPTTEEPTTEEPTTEEPTTEEIPTGPVEIGIGEYPDAIDALFNGKFYMKTTMENADGTVSEVEMGIDGEKMEIIMPVEGMKMAVLFDGNKTFIKIKFGIWYCSEITEELKDQGMGFDISEMTNMFQYGNIEDFKSIVKYNDTLDGKEYTVYSFASENGNNLCFYADKNDNIKVIITKDVNGEVTSRNDIESLSSDIPNTMFKTSGFGYVKIDLEGLFDMMNSME